MPQTAPSTHSSADDLEKRCGHAMQLQIEGRLNLAEPLYRSILEFEPQHGAANYGIGMLLVQSARAAAALPHLLNALQASPQLPDYWLGYLEALLLNGDTAQAVETLALARERGLSGRATDEFAARLRLATLPKPTRAVRRRDAARLRQQEAQLFAAVGKGRFAEALPLARAMTERFSEHGVGWKVYAALLWAAGSQQEALTAMQTSVDLLPADAEAHSNFGTALNKLQRLDAAEICLQRALRIDPDFLAAYSHLGDTYQLQGRYAEAEECFRRAMALYPGDYSEEGDKPHSSLLFMMNHNPDVDAAALFAEHCRIGAYFQKGASVVRPRPAIDREPERCLNVGVVSADLRNHAVASFIEPVLREWQSSAQCRVSVYSVSPEEDDVSHRLCGYVAHWHRVAGLADARLVKKIVEDEIDILVDLSGHTAMHRLRVFAHRPAPVQVSWLGYPGTTGLSEMDYYLADRHFLPPGRFENHFSESLAYVPTVWPFEPLETAPPVNALPALGAVGVCFGSFNRLGKINEASVRLWSALMRALPDSTLLIAGVPLDSRHRQLIAWFVDAGVARERLTFEPYTTQEAHLALHHRVDMALETTPYTGCTTSNHALWMGVPSLTLAGDTAASRLCAANLGHLGLPEFIAQSPAEFVDKGVHFASHRMALAQIRATLRDRWRQSPSRQSAVVARGIERGLRHMWRRWCAGLPPETFEIT